jgi:hypothetical protein
MSPRIAAVALLIALAAGCHESPTEPQGCVPLTVFASQPAYEARPEAEADFRGTVHKNYVSCEHVSPGRSLCLSLDRFPMLYPSSSSFDAYIGQEVIVRGKMVDVGFGPEIWPASIRCR